MASRCAISWDMVRTRSTLAILCRLALAYVLAARPTGRGAPAHAGKLGFGLWWVRALMMRLGGAVWVESDGNSGTTFILRFPKLKG